MAKKGGFKDERKLAAAAREGGYEVSQKSLDALTKNLLTTQAGIGSTYTESTAKTLARMAELQGRIGSRAGRAVARGESQVANLYGTATAGGAKETFRPSEVAASGTAKAAAASLQAGAGIAKAGSYALAIQQAAASEASESAAYQLASALAYRARDDAALILEKKLALQQTRLQYKLDLENQKKMYDYTQKMENRALGGKQGATDIAQQVTSLLPNIRLWLNDHPNGTLDQWLATNRDLLGSNPQLPEYLREVFAAMKTRKLFETDQGYGATVDAVVDSLLTMNPQWVKFRPELEKWVLSSLKTSWNAETSTALGGSLDWSQELSHAIANRTNISPDELTSVRGRDISGMTVEEKFQWWLGLNPSDKSREAFQAWLDAGEPTPPGQDRSRRGPHDWS